MLESLCIVCGKIYGGPRYIANVRREYVAENHIHITCKFSAVKMAMAGDSSSDDRGVKDITKGVHDMCIDADVRQMREEMRQLDRSKRMFDLVNCRDARQRERAARDTA